MLAHINTSGNHIPLYLDGVAPLGWGRNAAYPIQEGTFVGDIFASPPVARYCGGRGFGSNIVAGRIGDTGQNGEPYVAMSDPYGGSRCDNICARDASGDGYTSCSPIAGEAITVWRQLTDTPAFSFESNTSGFSVVVNSGAGTGTVALATDRVIHGTHALVATLNPTSAGQIRTQIYDSSAIVPGKNMTVFVNIPSGQNWSYVSAFVTDGPAKNYRFTSKGYNKSQIITGEWASIVVPVPADFSTAYSHMGVQIDTTASGTIKLYVDAVIFGD